MSYQFHYIPLSSLAKSVSSLIEFHLLVFLGAAYAAYEQREQREQISSPVGDLI